MKGWESHSTVSPYIIQALQIQNHCSCEQSKITAAANGPMVAMWSQGGRKTTHAYLILLIETFLGRSAASVKKL